MNKRMMASSRKVDFKILKRLLAYIMKVDRWSVIGIFICVIFASLGPICISIFLQRIVDGVIVVGIREGFDSVKPDLFMNLGIMGTLYAIALLSSLTYTQLNARLTQLVLARLRQDMFSKMETLPISYFDQNKRGDIMSTYTNDVDAIRELIGSTLPQCIQTILVITFLSFFMIISSPYLFLVPLTSVIFILNVAKKVGGGSAKYFIKQQKSLASVEGYVEEMMNGQKVVKVFNYEKEAIEGFRKLNEELRSNANKASGYANMLGPIIFNIGNTSYVLVAIVGTILVLFNVPNLTLQNAFVAGESIIEPLTIGIVVSFLTMARQYANNFNQISMQINTVVMALAGANRVFNLLDQESEVDDGYVELVNACYDENGNLQECDCKTGVWAWKHPHADGTITYTLLKGDIVLTDVDFGYNKDKIVLHDVSVYAKPGQKIALVGSTGAGKTTITNLITRFYDLADGKVRYDGININKIKKGDLRRSIGMVLQDTSLFTGTVKDNIKYGKLDATDEEVIKAAKIANAYDFISRLPQGFDTMLTSNGDNLSQGQRQLISIARAAIADAPVMILDEATSSIDTRTEKLVQKGMDQIMEGRTIFVIAHRLSTIQNSDAIMVLENGRIIERGSHDSLIEEKGVYYQLYTGAFELE